MPVTFRGHVYETSFRFLDREMRDVSMLTVDYVAREYRQDILFVFASAENGKRVCVPRRMIMGQVIKAGDKIEAVFEDDFASDYLSIADENGEAIIFDLTEPSRWLSGRWISAA